MRLRRSIISRSRQCDAAGPWLHLTGLLVMCALTAASAQDAPESGVRTIRTMQQYWEVATPFKQTPHGVDMELRLTYFDPHWNLAWAEGNGTSFYLPVGQPCPDLRTGQRIRVEGSVVPAEEIRLATLKVSVLPSAEPLIASRIDGALMDAGRFDAHYVELSGLVEAQNEVDPQHLELAMVIDGCGVTTRVLLLDSRPVPNLAGRMIRFDGVFVARRDSVADRFGADCWVGNPDSIRVLGPLSADPVFDQPITAIEDLPRATPQMRVRIAGKVHAMNPGESVTVRDGTGQILVNTVQRVGLALGAAVELAGVPKLDGPDWTVSRALFRPRSAATEEQAVNPAGLSRLRLADQVLSLHREEAAREYPVQVQAVVTWSHPDAPFFFVRDSSGGIRVSRHGLDAKSFPALTLVRVSGVSAAGKFAPEIRATQVAELGPLILPVAPTITLEQALTGVDEAQWVEMRGFVRRTSRADGWARLHVTTGAGEFEAVLPPGEAVEGLVGAVVRVRGVCAAVADEKQQLDAVQLWVQSLDAIRVDEAAPADPYSRPRRTIASLRQFSSRSAFDQRVRISGLVMYQSPANFLIVQEATGAMVCLGVETEPLQPGDSVDVVGTPGTDGRRPVLRESVYRKTGIGVPPAPIRLDSSTISAYENDCQLVTVESRVVDVAQSAYATRLTLLAGGVTFDALLDHPRSTTTLPTWEPDSVLEVTGIYRLRDAEGRNFRGFNLQLRGPADVRVLARAPWLTPARAASLGVPLGVLVLFAVGWVYYLRGRVREQTALIVKQVRKETLLENRQRNIVENASDFIFAIDLNGRFTLFNTAGERITGYTQSETARLTVFHLLSSEDTRRMRQVLALAEPDMEVRAFQTRFRRKDGEWVWVEVTTRFIAEDGVVTGLLAVARDCSERVRVEEELKLARDAAEASTRAKSQFLANMSHEIRTPMNGVIGMTNLLLDTGLHAEQRDYALTIRKSADALLTVMNDILDFSKIEAGKLEFEALDFDLTEVVEDAVDLLAPRAEAKRLDLALILPEEMPQALRGDPGRLRQVLLNLVGNAIKFTPAGSVMITVSAESESPAAVTLRFSIADTGIGMNAEDQAKLFQPFSQADLSTTRRFGGTGLGLAISKQIVELMGGRIGVGSALGKGSTFWFVVALAKQPSGTSVRPTSGEVLRGVRVLGLLAEKGSRTAMQRYLSRVGAKLEFVDDVTGAQTALREARDTGSPYRIVVADPGLLEPGSGGLLPVGDGNALSAPCSLVLLSMANHRMDADQLRPYGAVASVQRPFRRRELMRCLSRVIAPDTTPAESPPRAAGDRSPGDGDEVMPPLRVLIAEDNPVNQRLTRIQLEKLGYQPDLASNGLEVLEMFERGRYDVILLDCQMPELDGYETARRLADHPRRATVRIIAMTANAMQGDREKCLAAGMDDYLSKPTRPVDLKEALRRARPVDAPVA